MVRRSCVPGSVSVSDRLSTFWYPGTGPPEGGAGGGKELRPTPRGGVGEAGGTDAVKPYGVGGGGCLGGGGGGGGLDAGGGGGGGGLACLEGGGGDHGGGGGDPFTLSKVRFIPTASSEYPPL